jgi:hypothetical protein
MSAGRINEDMNFAGAVRFSGTVVLPNTSVATANIAAAGLATSALKHQYAARLNQPNTAATAETRAVHEVVGATATALRFAAGSVAIAVGAATVTVDVKKNGTSILSAPITLDNANTAYVAEEGTISTPGAVAGDVYTIVTTATAGGGTLPTGVFATLTLDEDYAS